jgi:diguanylate cyclase (GGDEF)-like protein
MGRTTLMEAPPRLVLRFALVAGFGLALAAGGTLYFVRQFAVNRAEHLASFHAAFVADTILRDRLRPEDFTHPVTGRRRIELDGLFRREVLVEGAVRVKLWGRDGRVSYSNDPSLIGTRSRSSELTKAFSGRRAIEVGRLNDEGGGGKDMKVLSAYVPVSFTGDRTAGVFELYQDYAPVARSARDAFIPVALTLVLVLLGLYAAFVPLLRRVTRRLREQVAAIEHQALHDSLTELPNRLLLHDRVAQAVLAAERDGDGLAVLLIDLDRFKEINDTLGHQSGDLMLREIGGRLARTLRASDTVARLGGDEFAVLARGVGGPGAALEIATKLRETLHAPLRVSDLSLEVEASIGVALYPQHGTDVETLLRHADVAMYLAKEARTGAELYSTDRDQYSPERLQLIGELRRGLEQGELVVYYQPKIDVATGRAGSVEALVRWRHPDRGLLAPDQFVPLAEHTGQIRALTRHVLNEALSQCRSWLDQGLELGLAVNISGRDLLDLHLPGEVADLLVRWRVPARLLELEITENTILSDPDRTHGILRRFRELGVRLAIDDFGSGYSSLAYLKRLPLDVLKIDKSFVLNMEASDSDAAIVRSTIDLAHNLGLEVVAEGVETREVLSALEHLHCDAAQGFHFARPLPPEELTVWLSKAHAAERLAS